MYSCLLNPASAKRGYFILRCSVICTIQMRPELRDTIVLDTLIVSQNTFS